MSTFTLVTALLALSIAWYLGYRMRYPYDFISKKTQVPKAYLEGINFLLNEETDKAVDVFIKMLEVDSETVETHMAVAKLFRRRGEVDRAIRIHQNLIARPQLDKQHHEQAMFELGQDYLSAGMLDRAERIFMEITSLKENHIPALRALLDIYQQMKSWQSAIHMAQKLEAATQKNLQDVVAHYYCELAETVLQNEQAELAENYLKRAIDADRQCVRASLLQARLDMERKDYKSAMRNLKYIKAQNPDYLSEAIEPLAQCFEKLQEEDKLVSYLKQLLEEYPRVPVVLILADRIRKWRGDKIAAGFVADYVRQYPSMRGLQLFINIHLANAEGRAKEDLLILQGLMNKFLSEKPDYQCLSCGFSGKSLYWLCPSCKQWSSIKPIHCIEEAV